MNIANRKVVNKEVAVTALYFQGKQDISSFPKRMEYDGREYTFLESGLRYLIHKGRRIIQIFDMTDGSTSYRLELDTDQRSWKLVDVSSLSSTFA